MTIALVNFLGTFFSSNTDFSRMRCWQHVIVRVMQIVSLELLMVLANSNSSLKWKRLGSTKFRNYYWQRASEDFFNYKDFTKIVMMLRKLLHFLN